MIRGPLRRAFAKGCDFLPYCMYLRKSRADLEAESYGEGETLARHRSALLRLSQKLKKPIDYTYQEIVSGETISDRPKMQKLLADVSAGKWDGVYVMEIERLARGDTMDQGLVFHAFRYSGTLILTPSKIYDPANPADEEYFEFSLFMSRREYKAINRRLRAGVVSAAMDGKWPFAGVPFGYQRKKLESEKGCTLEPVEPAATIVRNIFNWYFYGLDGKPAGALRIAHHLIEIGAFPERRWSSGIIYNLLRNPAYAGRIRYGRMKSVRAVTPGGIQKRRELDLDCPVYPGRHPAIIDPDFFDAVQAKMDEPAAHFPVRKNAELQNPLIRFVFCGECGRRMKRVPAPGREPYLRCPTHGCPTVQGSLASVEQTVLETLRHWLDDPGSMLSAPEAAQDETAALRAALESLTSERQKIAAQIERAQELVEQSVYTVEQYAARYSKLNAQDGELAEKIRSVEAQLSQCVTYAGIDDVAPAIHKLLDDFGTLTPLQRNELYKQCISRIVYTKYQRGHAVFGAVSDSGVNFALDIYPLVK